MNNSITAQIRQVRDRAALSQLANGFLTASVDNGVTRVGATPERALFWPDPSAVDLTRRFEQLLTDFNLPQPAQGPIALHAVLRIPSSWIEAAGSVIHARNPRNTDLLRAAIGCIRCYFGENGVLLGRVALDAADGGVADVVIAPIYLGAKRRIVAKLKMKHLMDYAGERSADAALTFCWQRHVRTLLANQPIPKQQAHLKLVSSRSAPTSSERAPTCQLRLISANRLQLPDGDTGSNVHQ